MSCLVNNVTHDAQDAGEDISENAHKDADTDAV